MRDGKPYNPEKRKEDLLERPLPSSEDAERCVLGGILLDNKLISEAAETLEAEDFYSPLNKRIYQAMLNLHMQGKTMDAVLIVEEMKKEGSVDAVGGAARINELTVGLPYFSSLSEWIKVIVDTKQKRDIIRTCNQIVAETLSEEDDIEVVADRVEQAIFSVCERPEVSKPERIDVLVHKSLEHTWKLKEGGIEAVGVPSGLKDLDEKTGGWRKKQLIIVGGRPSMGKSALGGQFADEGSKNGRVVAIFTPEMSKEEIAARYICSDTRVNLNWYTKGDLLDHQYEQARRAQYSYKDRTLFVDDTPNISPMQMMAKCRRLYAQHKRLDLIVVDYLQLMSCSKKAENRLQEVSQISRELKLIAKMLDVPVIALCQLSRAPELRNPPRPIMSDLRESGTIEQDADVVLFVYRDEYYKETEENKGIAELIVAKQRNGPTGTVKTTFLSRYTKFENYHSE